MSALAPADPATATGEASELLEQVQRPALNVLTNYFNVLADVENDWPVVRLDGGAA